MTMTKSKIAIVATLATMLVAGASSAMAFDRQATDDALSYASVQAAQGFGGTAARVRTPANAFASARQGRVHVNPVQSIAPMGGRDFQLQGRGLGLE
jgi:hypothetical protein